MPVEEMIRYHRKSDYVDHFRFLFKQAVNDRIATAHTVGILMSGGLDSTSVAVTSATLQKQQKQEAFIHLFTLDSKEVWPEDEEVAYAQIVADRLKRELSTVSVSAGDLYQPLLINGGGSPEPLMQPFIDGIFSLLPLLTGRCQVMLTGQGGDPAFAGAPFYLLDRLAAGYYSQCFADSFRHVAMFHRLPPLSIRTSLKRRYERKNYVFSWN